MTRRLAALGLGGLALLAYVVEATPVPTRSPAEALANEGREVWLRGVVRDLRVTDGVARFDLVLDGNAVGARLEGEAPPEGTLVEARGRLGRLGGSLTLFAERVRPAAWDAGLPVSLAALAEDPATWHDQAVNVTGVADRGRLKADGHSVALGSGDWPRDGVVNATVMLVYDPACACHRLDRVTPWTS
ncbi:MAG: hypothetical protein AABY18_05110 [Candidatus Thermoplasmatota archaeon]